MTTGARTPGRPRRYREDEALEAALRLFWRQGYSESSMAQIREATGMSSASLGNAFGTKQELFERVVDHYFSTYGTVTEAALDDTLPPREALERSLRQSLQMQCDPSHPAGCLIALSGPLASDNSAGAMEIVAARRQGVRKRIRHAVDRGIDSGELDGGTDPGALTASFHAFLLGLSTEICDGTPRDDLDGAIGNIMQLWDAATAS
jgi:AcrR family transcriptional regulator